MLLILVLAKHAKQVTLVLAVVITLIVQLAHTLLVPLVAAPRALLAITVLAALI